MFERARGDGASGLSERLGPTFSRCRDCVDDFIVRRTALIAKHHSFNRARDNSDFNIVARKGFDSLQRLPQRNNLKFRSLEQLSPQYGCANEPWKRNELWKRLQPEVCDISVSKLSLAKSPPMPRYHRVTIRHVADGGCGGA